MNALLCFLFLMTTALAQDPTAFLKNFDSKIYSLKTKGVTDFSVEVDYPRLTRQLNEQQTFGKVSELVFKIYWTADPERFAIEVHGLPDGFVQVKEELKASIAGVFENIVPIPTAKKLQGYKLSFTKPLEILAQDTSGIARIPSFTLKFDEQSLLSEVIGNKPIGTLVVKTEYTQPGFADGKWVLQAQKTVTAESGQTLFVTKALKYEKFNSLSAPSELTVTTEQAGGEKGKVTRNSESIYFKNYLINQGAAMKYFLSEGKVLPKSPELNKNQKPE
jgi:hypothetical protein